MKSKRLGHIIYRALTLDLTIEDAQYDDRH